MRTKRYDSFLVGFMIGATVPLLAYWGIEIIFETLTDHGIMDEVTNSTFGKRKKTLALLAICGNLIPSQLANNFRNAKALRGIVFATLIYAACWVLYFFFNISF